MRKNLLIAAALCLATSAMAQTSFGTALQAQQGQNIFKDATTASAIYWQFTADKDYIATIGRLEEDGALPEIYLKQDGNEPMQIDGAYTQDGVVYAFQEGKTYYFKLNKTSQDVGFSLKLEETSNLGKGLSEDDPMEIKLGETQIFGNPHYQSESYAQTNIFSTYKAEKNGQLRIKTSQYVSSATVNGTRVASETIDGEHVFKINTEAGQTYQINFSIYDAFFIATSEVVEVKAGSFDMPFVLNEGENTVPAEAGKYYFTYAPKQKGYLNITSDAALTGGQVSVYMNKINASNERNAVGQSQEGEFNVRTEITSTYATYYIVVNKTEATQESQTFKCQEESYQPGETEDTAIPVTVGETATTVTAPNAKGTYYYSITIPANTNKFLVVESATDLSDGTSVSLNTKGSGTWGASKMTNRIIKKDIYNTTEKTYTLTVTSNESAPLQFSFSYADVDAGSLITSPKAAVAGDNTIDFDGAEYYTYTATKSGKLAVEVGEGVTVSFPQGTGKYDGTYDTYQKGNTYFIEATEGTTYLISIDGVTKGSTFTLAETEFEAGEVRTNPIAMDGSTYTLGEKISNVWLKYTVTKTGVIDFSSDIPFDYDTFVGIAKNQSDAVVSMADNTKYQSVFNVKEGDELYIQVNTAGDVSGKKLTLVEREPVAGESINNPIILEKGQTIDVSKASNLKPIWVRVKLTKGKNTFAVTGGYITPLVSCHLATDGITYEGTPVEWGDNVNINGEEAPAFSFSPITTINMDIMIGFAEGEPKLTYYDETSGISGIEVVPDSKPSIYTLDGTKIDKISGDGIYIIKSNGTTKKVVIKK